VRPGTPSGSGSEAGPKRTSEPPPGPPDLEPWTDWRKNLKYDLPASVVVFLVALPLCLGIAVASDAPPLAGLIAGIIGGTVVAILSGSHTAVSGPAAGLAAICVVGIDELGWEGFLLATVLGGAFQLGLGLLRAGIFAYYFPSSVIKGMLAAIGIILILKQIPHALGFDQDYEGDLTLFPAQGQPGPIESLQLAFEALNPGAIVIAVLGLAVLILWSKVDFLQKLRWLPGPLVAVLLGVGLNFVFAQVMPAWALSGDHVVDLPTGGFAELWREMAFPDFSMWNDGRIYTTAFTIGAVASVETLLCIEAMDKLDHYKRSTPTNRELMAQGTGNMLSGFLGGLPITAVIVRGSANIHAGSRSKISAIVHGVMLFVAVVVLASAMNLIPLAALAAILLHVGYKLARFELFRDMFKKDVELWAPFIATIGFVLWLDLLKGVGVGLVVALFFILRRNLGHAYFMHEKTMGDSEHPTTVIQLSENVSFLNKASVNRVLHELPDGASVIIDGSRSEHIHADVLELIHDFESTSSARDIEVQLVDIPARDDELPAKGAH